MTLRMRIQTLPPNLPSLRVWLSPTFPSSPGATGATILDLKRAVVEEIPALKQAGVRAGEVLLVLDEFELMDGTGVGSVVRDGDLVCVKRRALGGALKLKLERNGGLGNESVWREVEKILGKRKERIEGDDYSSSSSSSSGSNSSSSSSSSSTSNSSSSFDSSPSSASSSSSSKNEAPVPSNISTKCKQVPMIHAKAISQKSALHVPPGLGRPATHRRNERRKRKKLAERAAQVSSPLAGSSEANSVPLGLKSVVVVDMDVDELPEKVQDVGENSFMMASLRNKNKKKGFFKQAMMKGLSDGSKAKIVFGEEMEEGEVQQAVVPKSFPRLVPPSELQEQGLLPKNMFVTSVDVEEGLWEHAKKNKKRKEKDRFVDAEEEVIPDGEPESMGLNWGRVEIGWDNYPVVASREQIEVGKLVGWKGLSLNPATLTPEVMLSLARVLAVEGAARIRLLERPVGEAAVAFGLGEKEGEDEEVPWDAVLGSWRLIE